MRILLFGFFYFTGSPAQRVFFSFSVFTHHVWLPTVSNHILIVIYYGRTLSSPRRTRL